MFRITISLLLLIGAFTVTAQLQVVQNEGHKLMISAAAFSEDDRLIYTGGWDGKIKVWDRESFKEIYTLSGHLSHIQAILPTEDKLYTAGFYEVFVWSKNSNYPKRLAFSEKTVELGKIENLLYVFGEKGIHQYDMSNRWPVQKTIYDTKSTIVDAVMPNDTSVWMASEKMVYLVNLKTAKLITEFSLPRIDIIKDISMSHDKRKLIVSGMNQIYIYDNATFEHERMLVEVHNSGVMTNDEIVGIEYQKYNVMAFDADKSKEPTFLDTPNTPIRTLLLSNSGTYLLGFDYSEMTLWDLGSKTAIHTFKKSVESIDGISISGTSFSCGVGAIGEARIFDLKTLQFETTFKEHLQLVKTTQLTDENVWLFGQDNLAIKFDRHSLKILDTFNIENPKANLPPKIKKTGIELIMQTFNSEMVQESITLENGDIIFVLQNDIKVFDHKKKRYDLLKGHSDFVHDIDLLDDQNFLLSAGIDKKVILWNLKKNKIVRIMEGHSERVFAVAAISDYSFVSGSANGELAIWLNTPSTTYFQMDKLQGAIKDIAANKDYIIVAHDNGINLYSSVRKTLIKTILFSNVPIRSVDMLTETLFISVDQNHKIQIWDINRGNIATLIVTKTGGVVYTDDGYYFGDKKSVRESIHFKNNEQVYLFDQFDLKFNRPDIIAERIGLADKKLIEVYHSAYLKRLKILGLNESDLTDEISVPTLNIEDDFESVTEKDYLHFQLKAKDSKKITRLNIWVNDVPVYGKNGKALMNPSLEMSILDSLELISGKNKIQFSVTNSQGLESLKLSRYITKNTPKTSPDLYLICIGASKYEQAEYNLTYAAKDAKDIRQLFESQNNLFGTIHAKTYFNEEVTKKNLSVMANFLKSAQIDDQVIIFIAGHGVLDANLDYFFATYDMDFKNPALKGIAYDEIENLLDGIRPLKKTLLIDACHSGEIDKDELMLAENEVSEDMDVTFRAVGNNVQKQLNSDNTFELTKSLFSDLRKGTGANIISSAGGMEFAIEGDDWNNGLFTYCFLNGIKSKEADSNKDGEIWLSEVQVYVSRKVAQLSGGLQQPTSRAENQTVDFRLW